MAKVKEVSKYISHHPSSQALDKENIKNMSVSSWTFFYHKPYECDWKEAKHKAAGKKWKGIE